MKIFWWSEEFIDMPQQLWYLGKNKNSMVSSDPASTLIELISEGYAEISARTAKKMGFPT